MKKFTKFMVVIFSAVFLFASCAKKDNKAKIQENPKTYLSDLLNKDVEESLNSIKTPQVSFNNLNEKIDLTVSLTKDGKQFIKDNLMDLGWLNSISLKGDFSIKDEKWLCKFAAMVNSAKLNADLYMDNSQIAVCIPAINDSYLGVKNDTLEEVAEFDFGEFLTTYMQTLSTYSNASGEFTKFIKGLSNITFGSFTRVEADVEESLEAEGIIQDCSLIKAYIEGDDLGKAAKDILKYVKKDQYIKGLLDGVSEIYNILEGSSYRKENFYKDVVDEIDDLLDEFDYEDFDGAALQVNFYVDSQDEIRGFEVYAIADFNDESEKFFSLKNPQNDGKYGLSIDVADEFAMTSVGTVKGSVYSGDVKIVVEDEELFTFTVDSYDASLAKKGQFATKLSAPIPLDEVAMLVSNPGMAIEVSGKENSAVYTLTLTSDKKPLASFKASIDLAKSSAISAPSKVVYVENEEDVKQYISKIDLSSLSKIVNAVGAPKEYTDLINESLDEIDIEDLLEELAYMF